MSAPPYAVRSSPFRPVYEVYEVATGLTVASFSYGKRRTRESDRGIAHGRANATREDLNRKAQREAK